MDKKTIHKYFDQDYSPFYRAYLQGSFKPHGEKVQALCPFHQDNNPSLSIDIKTGLFKCFGCTAKGDVFDFYALQNNLNFKTDFQKILAGIAREFNIPNSNGKREIFATYEYQDASGNLLYGINRYNPKSFSQWKPDGKGGRIPNVRDIKPVLYHLPEVIRARQVFIVEGEKDVDSLRKLGFDATCNTGGAGHWKSEYSDYLTGKDCILIPDNDQPGRDHMNHVAASLKGKAKAIWLINLWGIPEKGDVSDWIEKFYPDDPDAANERLCIMIDGSGNYEPEDQTSTPEEIGSNEIKTIIASDWLNQNLPQPDQVIEGVFETGDKVAIISSSKSRKSFFLLQASLCISTNRDFLRWHIPRPRRVLYCQFEIKEHHLQRRIIRMCRALGIVGNDLVDRFIIINGRGKDISGEKGINRIWEKVKDFRPEVIAFDPLYKLMEGVENAAEDGKKILNTFDKLIEKSGAAVLYIHHDAKGSPGDRDIRDRGAGSNVIARDYDACITLTAHATDPDSEVVETLLRNYRPQEPFTVRWSEDEETGGYRFELRQDIIPEKKTSKSKNDQLDLSIYLPIAESILAAGDYEIKTFKERFKEKSGLGDHRLRSFITWATTGNKPHLITREDRGKGIHKKWISIKTDS